MKDDKPHYLGHRSRIRERFVKQGLEGFSDYEAMELLLTWMIPQRDLKPIAKRLIAKFGDFRSSLDASKEELMEVKGIGEIAATGIKFHRSIIDRYLLQQASGDTLETDLTSLKKFCRTKLGSQEIEVFHVFFFDTGYRMIANEELERGTIDRAVVYPRQVIDAAMRYGASHLVLAHNHPNGNVNPTDQDKNITRAIILAGSPLDISVYDHLIVSLDEAFSFREAGLI